MKINWKQFPREYPRSKGMLRICVSPKGQSYFAHWDGRMGTFAATEELAMNLKTTYMPVHKLYWSLVNMPNQEPLRVLSVGDQANVKLTTPRGSLSLPTVNLMMNVMIIFPSSTLPERSGDYAVRKDKNDPWKRVSFNHERRQWNTAYPFTEWAGMKSREDIYLELTALPATRRS